ncbi:AraC family transcriptional regulator [Chitinophaga sp.]|uniref:helix-turn-helix transcriptional regulator n=1 Tax=Chitinophaga sp. TaxID=1869181 RepID=UPI002634680A|nr:AraC family transcriptional regulator [uncultured Chitinophaga sp.]
MPMTVTNERKEILFHDDTVLCPDYYNGQELTERRHELDIKAGKADFHEISFDGVLMGFGKAYINEKVQVESHDTLQRVGMHFMIRGEVTANIKGMRNAMRTRQLEHNLVYTPEPEEQIKVERQPEIQVFALTFLKDRFVQLARRNGPVLEQFGESVENDRPVFPDRSYQITPRMMQVIDEVRDCHFSGGLKKLFLQSKAIELLALECEQIELLSGGRYGKERPEINRTEEERIRYARDLLLANAQEPPSLGELSRLAGLNEFKLKSGFRKVFNNTVFGYLSEHRLDEAQRLVRTGAHSFTEIADELGYSSLQHFSNAFRKKFGCSPREFQAR